jgi:hypothetical protein
MRCLALLRVRCGSRIVVEKIRCGFIAKLAIFLDQFFFRSSAEKTSLSPVASIDDIQVLVVWRLGIAACGRAFAGAAGVGIAVEILIADVRSRGLAFSHYDAIGVRCSSAWERKARRRHRDRVRP